MSGPGVEVPTSTRPEIEVLPDREPAPEGARRGLPGGPGGLALLVALLVAVVLGLVVAGFPRPGSYPQLDAEAVRVLSTPAASTTTTPTLPAAVAPARPLPQTPATTVPGSPASTVTPPEATVTTVLSTAVPTTTAPPRPPAEVVVLVLNGSGVNGLAAARSEVLAGAGYQVLTPADAARPATATSVQHPGGREAEALAVAQVLGFGPEAVRLLEDPLPSPNLGGAEVVVVIGADQAG